jgi:hypothetical protein
MSNAYKPCDCEYPMNLKIVMDKGLLVVETLEKDLASSCRNLIQHSISKKLHWPG